MNVLLIGGSGFVGHAIAEHFLAKQARVASITRGNKPNPPGVESLKTDRTDACAFAAAINGREFDLVVDITAMTGDHVKAVTPALIGRTGHYVMISTDFVYATDIEQFPIKEDAAKDSDSAYAVGKLAAEAVMLAAWRDQKLPVTILRPPHIIGAGKELGSGSTQGRDKNLLRSMRTGRGLTLVGEGEYLLAPVWTRQIAQAIDACSGKPATFGQVMNCPGGEIVTTRRYYQLIADRLGVRLRYDSVSGETYRRKNPDKRSFARHRVYDMSKLRGLAGYTPVPQLQEAIGETVAWMEKFC